MPRRNEPEPIDVLVLSPHLAPPPGGVQRLAMDVADALGERRVRVVGVSAAPSPDPRVRVVSQRRGRLGAVITTLAYALAVLRELRRRPRVVHAMTWRAALPVLLVRRRPAVALYCMGGELVRAKGGRVEVATRRALMRRVTGVAAISRFTAELVRDVSGREATLIHPPVRTIPDAVTPHPPADTVRVLSVGRLVKNKGHDRLLRAVAALRAESVPITLTIAGSGPEEHALRALARELDLRGAARLATDVSDDELAALYGHSDVFALLSTPVAGEVEGFGIVFLEANAHGLPVVAGRSGGSVDAVEHGVSGIVADDFDQAVTALRSLATDPARRAALGRAGRDRVRRFSLAEFGTQLGAFHDACVVAAAKGTRL